jgi:RNA recognition motif-containing protein
MTELSFTVAARDGPMSRPPGGRRVSVLICSVDEIPLKEEPRPAMMIYVGNLDYTVTSDVLRALFEPYGAVTMAEVQVRSRTGQSRGFALVEMPNATEARAAIEGLNGQNHQDRPLTVNESRPRRTVRDLYTSGGWYGGGHG